jgi:hypothetical protein
MNRPGFLFLFILVLATLSTQPFAASAQVTATWTGSASADWNTAANWSTGSVPGTTDSVQIGALPFAHQPAISRNDTIAYIQFSGTADTLTINSGDTLRVSGSILQAHLAYNIPPNTVLQGNGTAYCATLVVGNGVLPKVVVLKSTLFESKIASLNISGNLIIRSYSNDLLSGAIAHNDAVFALEGGQLNLAGQIYLDNFWPSYFTSIPGIKPLAKFMVNINSNNNATLALSDTAAISVQHAGCDSVDFYHFTSGTGKSIVKYIGNSQLLYTNNAAGLDTLPNTYQNLYIEGNHTKTAGKNSTGNNLSTGGDLIVNSGTLDLQSFSAVTTVNGNFINRDTINIGSPGITFNGPSFVNDSVFNHNNAWITFSGGTQTLTDSTHNGTALRFLAFADTGTKSVNHGIFTMIPSGKVKLSNSVTVQVDTTGTFILQSDSTGTAAVTAIPSGSVMRGIVNAQWYVPGSPGSTAHRGYQLISSTVNHTDNTNGTGDFNPNWIKGTTLYDGALITGLNGHTNGFDTTQNPTIYIYREDVNTNGGAFTSGNWRGINKINNTDLNDIGTQKRFTITEAADTTVRMQIGNGILFYFRGNRVFSNGTTSGTKINAPYNYPENVTFTNKGTINQGQVQVKVFFRNDNYLSYTDSSYISNGTVRGENLVGNPYPSAINLDNFSATDSTAAIYGPGLTDTIEVLRPFTSTYDYYIPNPAHNRDSVYAGYGSATNIIASGQAFFVTVDRTSPNKMTASLRFREAAKFNPPNTMGSAGMMVAARKLTPAASNNSRKRVADRKTAVTKTSSSPPGNAILHINLFSGATYEDDVTVILQRRNRRSAMNTYMPDPDQANWQADIFAIHSPGTVKSKGRVLNLPAKSTSIWLYTAPAQSGSFSVDLSGANSLPANYSLKLRDKLTGTLTDMRKKGKYAFKIDKSNPNSYGDRLELIIAKK